MQELHCVQVALWGRTKIIVEMEHARLVLKDINAPQLLQNLLHVVLVKKGKCYRSSQMFHHISVSLLLPDVCRVSKNCLRLVVREQLPAAAVGQVLTRMSVVLEAVKLALRGMNAPQLPTRLQFVQLDSIGTSASCINTFDVNVQNQLKYFF